MSDINTHNLRIEYGKYKGELWTRLPISYLKWLVNQRVQNMDIAEAELERRGTTGLNDMEISAHAVDRVSQYCLDIWMRKCHYKEGLYSWLNRIANDAYPQRKKDNKADFLGMIFVFEEGYLYPTLKTVIKK